MSLDKIENKAAGPAIVAVANAARAFDAPVRYPLLFATPNAFPFSNGMLPRNSAFVTLVEHFLGFIILLPIFFFVRGLNHIVEALKEFTKKEWFSVVFISAGGSALGLFFFLISLVYGNPTVAIILQKSQPLITLAFAAVVLKERPIREYWIALAVSIFGILMLAYPDIIGNNSELNTDALIAVVASLLAATFWGGSTVFGRILTENKNLDHWDVTMLRYTGGFLFLIIVNLILFTYTAENFEFLTKSIDVFGTNNSGAIIQSGLSLIALFCIIYSVIFTGGILPLAVYYKGLSLTKASIAGLAELAFPVLAIFVNYIFLGFGLELIQIAGAVILLVCVTALSYINSLQMEKEPQVSGTGTE